MKNFKRKIRVEKIPLKKKLRFLLLGKRPLERKYAPKIIEYLFILFANLIIFFNLILLLYSLSKYNFDLSSKKNLESFINELKTFSARLVMIITTFSLIVNIFMTIHLSYIYSKTEKAKLINILCISTNIIPLIPLSIIFAIWGYIKNEIAFE
ncbi:MULTISPECIES: hypothetical protein [unclassified Mycoplasma]|uniref:hypothetical protein n=1 Tax=unclassified Mycoplasma TaxID=2683645 RepID=UPI00211BE4AC|nr:MULTISPECIES: hypothetical protein [unclassified Mycoplasma]UUM19756.1 hypothetical protein NPA11_03230 [Mycoplasma sp. 1578d]UUM24739.1 hypothetical protein NPA12_03520 [Mycoplasma sp. 3686d]